jgi:hypothetical protein
MVRPGKDFKEKDKYCLMFDFTHPPGCNDKLISTLSAVLLMRSV